MAKPFNRRTFIQREVNNGIPSHELEVIADEVGLLYAEVDRQLTRFGGTGLSQIPEEGLTAIISATTEANLSQPSRPRSKDSLTRSVAEALKGFFEEGAELDEDGRVMLAGLSAEAALAEQRIDDAEGVEYDGLEDTTTRGLIFGDADREDADPDDVRMADTVLAIEEAQYLQEIGETNA
jgi:hypothetical protein